MRRFAVIVIAASLATVACGGEASTSEGSVAAQTAPASDGMTDVSSPTSTATSENVTDEPKLRLVSELPEISGPTVLWFWAPG